MEVHAVSTCKSAAGHRRLSLDGLKRTSVLMTKPHAFAFASQADGRAKEREEGNGELALHLKLNNP
jgi:hypothetical protein